MKQSWRQRLQHAFSLESDAGPLDEREHELLARVAAFTARRRMSVPAVMLLESVKPLGYLGSQVMAFFEPMARSLFSSTEYSEFRHILERREAIEILIEKIEVLEATSNQTVHSDEKRP